MKKFLSTQLEVKNITKDSYTVMGQLVRYDSVDLDGDKFSQETDFGLIPSQKIKSPIYYDHGFDKRIGLKQIGDGEIWQDESGVWIEAQLRLREKYEKDVFVLAKNGKLGWSSGTATHLTQYEPMENGGKHWKRWPLGLDASMTPIPADPDNGVFVVKNYSQGNITMENEETEDIGTEVPNSESMYDTLRVEFDGKFTSINETLQTLLKKFEETPIKSRRTAHVSQTGGNSDKEVYNLGDFLVAIKRKDTVRLGKIYGSFKDESATKDITVDTGTTGGYTVPHQFASEILQLAARSSPIMQKVTKVPVSSYSGSYPALDYTLTPTAGTGDTAEAAGVEDKYIAPGGTFTETTPTFTDLQWRVNKIGGYTEVQNEFSADSPLAIQTLLSSLFSITIGNKNERNVLRGNGVNEPMGILNSAAAIAVNTVTNNVFAWADALNMMSRFYPLNPGSVCWIFHPSIWPDLGIFETSAGGGVWQANMQAPFGKTLLGYELAQSQHSPQANNAGDVLLADLSMYLFFMRQELTIDFSEHVGFLTGKDTWRFYQRNDGKPWLKGPITLGDPQGSFTQSPFVYHND